MVTEATTERAISKATEHEHVSQRQFGSISGWGPVFADIGTSVYYVPGILATNPLIGLLAGFFVLIINVPLLLLSVNYAEVTHRFRQGGGVVTTASIGIGPRFGALGGWFILVDYGLTIAISVTTGILFFAVVYPIITPWVIWISILVIIGIGVLNWVGIKESIKVATIGAWIAFISDLLVLITVVINIPMSEIVALVPEMFKDHNLTPTTIIVGFAGSFLAFSGLESISQLSPVLLDPLKKTANRAIRFVFISFLATATPLTFLGTMILQKEAKDPIKSGQLIPLLAGHWEQVDSFHKIWGMILQFAVANSAATLLVFAGITGTIGAYHVQLALAKGHIGPSFLLKTNKFRGTPHYAIGLIISIPVLLLLGIALTIGLDGALSFLGDLYAFGLLGAFMLTCLGLHRIRTKELRLAKGAKNDKDFEDVIREAWHIPLGEPIPYNHKEVLSRWYSIKIWIGKVALLCVSLAWIVNLEAKPLALIFGGTISSVGMFISNRCYMKWCKEHNINVLTIRQEIVKHIVIVTLRLTKYIPYEIFMEVVDEQKSHNIRWIGLTQKRRYKTLPLPNRYWEQISPYSVLTSYSSTYHTERRGITSSTSYAKVPEKGLSIIQQAYLEPDHKITFGGNSKRKKTAKPIKPAQVISTTQPLNEIEYKLMVESSATHRKNRKI